MSGKIQKLSELNELLKSGVVTPQEFEILKNEILNDKFDEQNTDLDSLNINKDISAHQSSYSTRKKILLKSYPLKDGSFAAAPEIEYLDMSYITSDEKRVLKSFLSKKQLAAPDELTRDEIEISNKIFTKKELDGFYIKNNSQPLVKGLLWFMVVGLVTIGGYVLYDKNVFQLKDKIAEHFSSQVNKKDSVQNSIKEQVDEKESLKSFNDIELTLTDASYKKAKLYLGEPDKYEFAFGHLTKGYAIYYDRVSNNGQSQHLVLFLRMQGNQWGDNAAIEEIYSVDNNQKACFGIHCIRVSGVHINNRETIQLSNDLIGQWSRPVGDGCQIFYDERLILQNPICELHLKYSVNPPKVKLYFDKVFSKIPAQDTKIGTEVGECHILDNKLIINFSNFDSPYYGFAKHLVMDKEYKE